MNEENKVFKFDKEKTTFRKILDGIEKEIVHSPDRSDVDNQF